MNRSTAIWYLESCVLFHNRSKGDSMLYGFSNGFVCNHYIARVADREASQYDSNKPSKRKGRLLRLVKDCFPVQNANGDDCANTQLRKKIQARCCSLIYRDKPLRTTNAAVLARLSQPVVKQLDIFEDHHPRHLRSPKHSLAAELIFQLQNPI